ncbi:MAG TPA: DUF1610 domain-containing protein [Euryarchaeota archaeon]|nr:DUF1610 domain-containing protein [Euryarchaeota archaeon]HDY73682.1 DUF1610 domain-containing protein [Euryarchaeota archaeon]
MERLTCKSCGAIISIGDGSAKFPCPNCDEIIGRCARCRKLGKSYTSKCGFGGP